jgi:iron transport multicopper oxidase
VTEVDEKYQLDVGMGMGDDQVMYHLFNNVTYQQPIVPTLLSALSAPACIAMEPAIYGTSTNSFVLGYNKTIEIIVNNLDMSDHPC